MIEFKAECGHTVRAKDEDAGRAVRCSYCGQDATVPDRLENDELDRLFTDEDLGKDPGSRQPVSAQVVKPKRRWWSKRRRRGPEKEFNPFALVIKLCYYAFLIVIVILFVRWAAIPLIREYQDRGQITRKQPEGKPRVPKPRRPSPPSPSTSRHGLLRSLSGDGGLYVSCVPASARIYYLPVQAGEQVTRDRIDEHARSCSVRSAGKVPRVSRGEYLVEFALPWSDPKLNKYPGFEDFRRRLRRANSTSERRRQMNDYFVPDEADEVFVCERPDQIYLVRQYRGVQVRDKRWTAVRALFLPRIAVDGAKQKFFEVGPLIEYLPKLQYGVNEDLVRNELEFHHVAAADQDSVLEALQRFGVIPCRAEDSKTYLFKIDVATGELGVRDISDND